jgi:hypothetical protein
VLSGALLVDSAVRKGGSVVGSVGSSLKGYFTSPPANETVKNESAKQTPAEIY